jgi:hypothetical protein
MTQTSDVLVLSEAIDAGDPAIAPGKRAHDLLLPFLNAKDYIAVAIVHGTSQSAATGFQRAEEMLESKRAVVWVDRTDLIETLNGASASKLRKAFARDPAKIMTFFAPKSGKTNWGLGWQQLTTGQIDEQFVSAGLDR